MIDLSNWGDFSSIDKLIRLKRMSGGGSTPSTTKTVSGSLIHILDALAKPVKKFTATLEPQQSGSGDPSPTNIRPISGYTGVNVWVDAEHDTSGEPTVSITFPPLGKNLFDVDNAVVYNRYIHMSENVWYASTTSRSYAVRCLPDTTYTISTNNSNLTIFRAAYIRVRSIEETGGINCYGTQRLTESGSITITTGSDATYIVVMLNAAIIEAKTANLQIEYGTTASEYEAFTNTVYRGTLDVTTGVLTVNDGDVPQTYQLTPHQITTLLGENYVWADTGDSELTYLAEA